MDSWVALSDAAGGVLIALRQRREPPAANQVEALRNANDNEIRGMARVKRRLNE